MRGHVGAVNRRLRTVLGHALPFSSDRERKRNRVLLVTASDARLETVALVALPKIKNLLALGVSLKSAIQHGCSSNSCWQMSRPPVINQAISNAWLTVAGRCAARFHQARCLGQLPLSAPLLATAAGYRRSARYRAG
jgi:hypothetical protein